MFISKQFKCHKEMNSNSRKIGSRTSLFLRFYSFSLFFYYLFAFLVLKGLEFD